MHAAAAAKSLQSCPTLSIPMDCSLPGSSVYGIFQARILEWFAISFSRGSSRPGIEPGSSALYTDSVPSEYQESFKKSGPRWPLSDGNSEILEKGRCL